jgi:hypothetical protein
VRSDFTGRWKVYSDDFDLSRGKLRCEGGTADAGHQLPRRGGPVAAATRAYGARVRLRSPQPFPTPLAGYWPLRRSSLPHLHCQSLPLASNCSQKRMASCRRCRVRRAVLRCMLACLGTLLSLRRLLDRHHIERQLPACLRPVQRWRPPPSRACFRRWRGASRC